MVTSLSRAQELCESRGGRPGLPVPTSPSGLCGLEATLKKKEKKTSLWLVKTESRRCLWLVETESRRDQEEGGELDSHEEVRRFCGSRPDQKVGGGAWPTS